jgi:Ca2+/H+ antiporter, TMEM165/GDT1 family
MAALVVVTAAGLMVRAPLQRVLENPIRFVVGTMILTWGTFWTLGSLAGADVWPLADWSLVGLVAVYRCGGLVVSALIRARSQPEVVTR